MGTLHKDLEAFLCAKFTERKSPEESPTVHPAPANTKSPWRHHLVRHLENVNVTDPDNCDVTGIILKSHKDCVLKEQTALHMY